MEPQLVIPLDGTDQPTTSWPRILRIVAALSFIFALIATVNSADAFHSIIKRSVSQGSLSLRSISVADKYQASRGLLAIAHVGIGVFMLVAAFRLWRNGISYLPVMMAARLWLAIWLLNIAVPLYLFRQSMLEYISSRALEGIIAAAFPLMIVLTLREYSKSHPQP